MNKEINTSVLISSRIVSLLVVMFCIPHFLNGQTVSEFVEMARDHNPGIKALNSEYAAAQYWSDQMDDYPDPKVSLGVGILPVETRLGSQRVTLGISQSIPWKGLLKARAELASARTATLAYLADDEWINIVYAIRNAYAQLIMIREKSLVIEQKLKALDVLEDLAKAALRSGKGKLSNVLLVERNREALRANLLILEKEMEKPAILLNRYSGRPLAQKVAVITASLDELIGNDEIVLDDHPRIKTLEAKKQTSMAALGLLDIEKKPAFGVGLNYAFISGRDDVEIPHNGRDAIMPMGTISIPLNTSRFSARRQEEILMQEALDLRIEEMHEKFRSELATAQSSIELAELEQTKYVALKNITRETLQLMRTEYASEGTRFEELIRLELELIDYQEGIIQAEYVKNLAKATLNKFK